MMKQGMLLLVKFVAVWLVLAVMFGVFGLVFQPVWLYAAIVTVVAYLVGDLVILRMYGNAVAVVADIILSTVTLWAAMTLFNPARAQVPTISLGQALLVGVVIGIVEIFDHRFVASQLHFSHHRHEPAH